MSPFRCSSALATLLLLPWTIPFTCDLWLVNLQHHPRALVLLKCIYRQIYPLTLSTTMSCLEAINSRMLLFWAAPSKVCDSVSVMNNITSNPLKFTQLTGEELPEKATSACLFRGNKLIFPRKSESPERLDYSAWAEGLPKASRLTSWPFMKEQQNKYIFPNVLLIYSFLKICLYISPFF